MDLKITSLIEAVHDNVTSAVVINCQLTKWFSVEICVRQVCLLSPILFSLSLEFVMTYMKILCKEIKLDTNLSFNIGYADDITIVFNVLEKLQISTEELRAASKKRGMKINFSKCKIITSSEKDISRHIALASTAFGRPRNGIFFNISISTQDSVVLGMFAVCKQIPSLGNHTNKTSKTAEERKTTEELE